VSEGYRRRHVRPLFPEIPESICDCVLLPNDYCTQREELVHTRSLASEVCDAPVNGGKQHITYTRELLQCPMCGQDWWSYSQARTDHTYARDDETTVVGSVSYSVSHAVRCADAAEAQQLDAWLPRYLAALADREALFAKANGRAGGRHGPALLAAIKLCIELAEQSAATRMLSETSARARKLGNAERNHLHAELTQSVAILETKPEDRSTWERLRGYQRACADARLADPALQASDWTMEEWWTPALAGMRKLAFEIHAVRHAARGKALGSPEHRALRAIEDAIAARWKLHVQTVQWPHPECAFIAMVEHAKTIEPIVVARDMASWAYPDWICRQITNLLESGTVRPSRLVDVPQWMAVRTGLPDARERHQARAAVSYWLPIRRSRRAAALQAGR